MPKHYINEMSITPTFEYVKIVKTGYIPSEYTPDYNNYPLITYIYGLNQNHKFVCLQVTDTEPRFWTKQNPDDVDIPDNIREHITRIEYNECKTYSNKPEPLYTVYIDYPFNVGTIRQFFN